MYCNKCGNKLGDDVKFCQNCGTPVGEVPIQYKPIPGQSAASPPTYQSRGKIVTTIMVAIGAMFIGALVTYMFLNLRGTSIERTGDIISKSQVEAANAFASAIASDDFETAIALFGCGRRAKSLDFSAYLERTGSWIPYNDEAGYPSDTDIFTKANQMRLQCNAVSQIQGMLFSLNADEEYLDGMMKTDSDEGTLVAEISEYCSLENLDTFKIFRIDYAMPDTQNTNASIKNAESQAAIYGGQTIEDCTVLYEYNGKTYFGGMQFIQYEDGWYIYSATTLLGGQNGQGYLMEMSKSEYEERVETSDWDIE